MECPGGVGVTVPGGVQGHWRCELRDVGSVGGVGELLGWMTSEVFSKPSDSGLEKAPYLVARTECSQTDIPTDCLRIRKL